MKNLLNLVISFVITAVFVIFLKNNIEQLNLFNSIMVIVCLLLFFFIYKVSNRFNYVRKRKKILLIFGVFALNLIVCFLFLKENNIFEFKNVILCLLHLLLLMLVLRKRTDFKTKLFLSIVNAFCIPILFCCEFNLVFSLIYLVFAYMLVSIQNEYPFGKRNLIKYFCLGISGGILFTFNYSFIIPLVLLALFSVKDIGKKKTFCVLLLIFIFGLFSYTLVNEFELVSYFVADYELEKNSIILNISYIVGLAIIIFNYITVIFLSYTKWYKSDISKNVLLYYMNIVTLLVCTLFQIDTFNILINLSLICFALNTFQISCLPKINYMNRYLSNRDYHKVSCVIPNYNYANYICERIDSCLNQNYPLYELIVLDDCSTDNSVEIIKNKLDVVKRKYPNLKVKFVENKENSGNVFKQWQKAFELSTGDYLWIAEADDKCSKYFLNSTMKGFDDDSVILSYCESSLMDEKGIIFSVDSRCESDIYSTGKYFRNFVNDGINELKDLLCINNTIMNVSAVIFKKDKTVNVAEYLKGAQEYKLCGDWYFYSKMLLNGSVYYNSDSLNYHRIQKRSVTLSIDGVSKIREIERVQKSIANCVEIPQDRLAMAESYLSTLRRSYNIVDNVIRFDPFNNLDCYSRLGIFNRIFNKFGCMFKKTNIGKTIDIYEMKSKKVVADKKVSVVIPNYNYENYIIERIDSVLRQSYPIYELIILDDCSTDNSVDVINTKIKEIKENYSNIKIKFVPNKTNSGCVFSQWQKAFTESTGDFVWIAEADDSCHPDFLKKLMKAFDDEEVVLSYSESLRMDENNKIIGDDCREWMTVVSHDRWNKSYIKNGLTEIRESLCICNTIPNVSAVVFKKSNQVELIEECKRFKISGDWYLYYQLLLQGKIAYCSESLNYFRKHSNSTSTVAKKEVELEELLYIQNEIRMNVNLDSYYINKQRHRYGNLLNEVDKKTVLSLDKYIAKRIAWIIPFPIKGSGGIRTMIQNANYLVSIGYEVDIYVEEDYCTTNEQLKELIIEYYGSCNCNTYVGIELRKQYDLVFATYSILTADYVSIMDVQKKAYFIQDFEPWFEAMGELYLEMEKSYKYKLEGISIGNWLANKISTEFNSPMHSFPFCADLKVYNRDKNIKKEDAICFIYQPEKSRRCSNLGLKALRLVKLLRPNYKIYLYGSDTGDMSQFGLENLGIVNIEKCSELYNKCKVGLCISASNPSRIPFEMMACGLPVVDLYRENNFYDIPSDAVLLADATPEGLASALIKIIDDEKLQEEMSINGINFMKDYSLEKGFEVFGKFVSDYLNDELDSGKIKGKMYTKDSVSILDEVNKVRSVVAPMPVPVVRYSKFKRKVAKLRSDFRNKYNDLIMKIFRVR